MAGADITIINRENGQWLIEDSGASVYDERGILFI